MTAPGSPGPYYVREPKLLPREFEFPENCLHVPLFTLGMCSSAFVCIVSRTPISFQTQARDVGNQSDAKLRANVPILFQRKNEKESIIGAKKICSH